VILLVAGVLVVLVVLAGLAVQLVGPRAPGAGTLLVIGGGGLVVLLGGAAVVVGVGVDSGDDAARDADRPTSTTTRPATTSTSAPPPASDLAVREVALRVGAEGEFAPPPAIVDRLPARAVLLVEATGFPSGSSGVIEQCSAAGCGNAFPVLFGDTGVARVQYLVTQEFRTSFSASATCGPSDPPCIVRVSSAGAVAMLATVFGGVAPPPRAVTIPAPAGGFDDGDGVLVSVSGFTPGERVQAMLCAAPAVSGTARCGTPGPVAPFSIDADGTGRAALVVRRGVVGSERVACGRETTCGIVVVSAGSFVPGPVVPIEFAAGPAAAYDPTRVLTGLAIAALLLALATFLVRTTDWRKPTEADTPELDAVALVD
jgi:hypothetical protein